MLSDSFVNAAFENRDGLVDMAGMHLLLGHMSGAENVELRDSALDITASLMETNPSVCV